MTKKIEQIEKFRRPCRAVLNKISEIIEYLSDSRLIAGPGVQLRETAAGIVISAEQTENEDSRSSSGSSAYAGPFALSFNEDKTRIQINLDGAYLHTPCFYASIYLSTPPSIAVPTDQTGHIIYLDFEDPDAPFITYDYGGGGNTVAWHRVPVGFATNSSIEQWLYGSVVYSAQFAEIYG